MSDDRAEEVWDALFRGPAPLVTRIGIVPYDGLLRIGFGEQYAEEYPIEFRSAVTLTDYNAWELYRMLASNPAVQRLEAAAKAAKAAAQ